MIEMRSAICVVIVTVFGGCGSSEPVPTQNQQTVSLDQGTDSVTSRSELAKTIEAAKLFIEAGQPDEAKRVLQDAEANPVASVSDKALISALMAKAMAAGGTSNPSVHTKTNTSDSAAAETPPSVSVTVPQTSTEQVDSGFQAAATNATAENAAATKAAATSATTKNAAATNDAAKNATAANGASTDTNTPNAISNNPTDDLPGIIERVQPSVIKIMTNESLGSGFVVDDGLVVTNRHVMEGATKATVHFKDGRTHEVEGIVFDGKKLDLCILRCKGLSGRNSKPLQFASGSLRQGESLFTFGAPRGLEFSVSEGIVSAHRWIDEIAYVQTTAPISSGNSGGPLLSTKDGTLVGINTWTRVDGQNLNFAIAAEHLKKALTERSSQPAALDLTEDGTRTPLAEEASVPTFAKQMKTLWEEKVAIKRQALEPKLEKARASLASAESAAAKSACTVKLEELLYEHKTVGGTVILDAPKIQLSHLGKLEFGTYGFVQDQMPVLQILNEWSCLLYLDGVVFLLEDFPTSGITTDTVLTAKDGPVIYVSGTYKYTTRLGAEKQVFRLRPVWDLEELSEKVIAEQARLDRESAESRDAAISAALTRTWTSSSFNGQAQFERVFGIRGKFSVILNGTDGEEIRVPLQDFSDEDQAWIAEYRKHSKP